jgi:gas vesicle protein
MMDGGFMAAEDYGSKVVWLMAGIAIGATVALLYAPASGEETRRTIVKRTKEGREAISDSGREMLERGKEMYEKGRKMADDAAEMFERGRKIVEGTAANLKG